MEALRLEESPEAQYKTGKVAVLDPGLCIGCGVCAIVCPEAAITVYREVPIRSDRRKVVKAGT